MPARETPGYDPHDPNTWPDATIVVRGGDGKEKWLRKTQDASGGWSVQSDPAATFGQLAACVPQVFVRRTSLSAVRDAGGWLVESHGPNDYHCDLDGLSPEDFDNILSGPEDNPSPRE